VHRLSVAKNDTKTNLQRSPETGCRLIKNRFAAFTLPYRGLQDSLHRATTFSDQTRIPNICHGSNHICLNSQALFLVSGPGNLSGRDDRSQTRFCIGYAFNQLAAKLVSLPLTKWLRGIGKFFATADTPALSNLNKSPDASSLY